jgi:hypothetical protein
MADLHNALRHHEWEEARRLIADGVGVYEERWDSIFMCYFTSLRRALFHKAPIDIIEALLLAGINPNEGHTLDGGNDLCKLKLLLEYGADPNLRGHRGQTALYHRLIMVMPHFLHVRIPQIMLFLRYGADPDLPIETEIPGHEQTTVKLYVRDVAECRKYYNEIHRRNYRMIDDILTGVQCMMVVMSFRSISKGLPKDLWRMLRSFLYISQL